MASLLLLFSLLPFGCSRTYEDPGEYRSARIAVFNIRELSTEKLNEVDGSGVGANPQLLSAAQIIQKVRPDILILNEIDHDYQQEESGLNSNAIRFIERYLKTGADAIEYEHVFAAPCNTGILSGIDLNGDGLVATPKHEGERQHGDDSFGFGVYPGQYSMALLSRFPIDEDRVRTFQKFLWKDLPENHLPESFYSGEATDIFRLSSKSHWDVPVLIEGLRVHLLLSHPTPPAFDGDEDRNGRRNFDEIGFWARYLENDAALYDDEGVKGGFSESTPFIIAGDLNADPRSQESIFDGMNAIQQLLGRPQTRDTGVYCVSAGALRDRPSGKPNFWERNTAAWKDGSRVDYLLPSRDLEVLDGGVFWPDLEADPEGHRLAETASDHRLVWIDIRY
jgi:endonuclease/exonuclease/phosphatase family metal-dependent hydrolase